MADNKKKTLERIERFLDEYNFVSPWIYQEKVNPHLVSRSASFKLSPNEILYFQGELDKVLYYVKKGRMRISFINQTGGERCVMILEEGALLGETSVLGGYHHRTSAMAITDVELGRLGQQGTKALINEHPGFLIDLMNSLALKHDVLRSHIEYDSKSSLVRIGVSLLALVIRYGQFDGEGMLISVRFTHEELANLNNLNRVTVSKGLGRLSSMGIISTDRSRVYIHSIDGLMDIVHQESGK